MKGIQSNMSCGRLIEQREGTTGPLSLALVCCAGAGAEGKPFYFAAIMVSGKIQQW